MIVNFFSSFLIKFKRICCFVTIRLIASELQIAFIILKLKKLSLTWVQKLFAIFRVDLRFTLLKNETGATVLLTAPTCESRTGWLRIFKIWFIVMFALTWRWNNFVGACILIFSFIEIYIHIFAHSLIWVRFVALYFSLWRINSLIKLFLRILIFNWTWRYFQTFNLLH